MAIRVRSTILLAALFLGFLSAPATARPCKTLFITFSIEPVRVHRTNPNFLFIDPAEDRPAAIRLPGPEVSSDGGLLIIDRFNFDIDRPNFPRGPGHADEQPPSFLGLFPLPREGLDFDSLFDRTKDVLSVVVALLFGFGCGALTAATMYFAWILVVGRREDDDDEEEREGFYSDYDDIPSPKKGGYVKIAQAAPAQVKEVA
uniref:Uncharacterized protein n=1 Tax=Kalanchoe fedtschenkoi TaxID=63787 RepID=A0A7N0SWT6_KALFE